MLPASLCAKIMVFRRITRIIEVVLNERAVFLYLSSRAGEPRKELVFLQSTTGNSIVSLDSFQLSIVKFPELPPAKISPITMFTVRRVLATNVDSRFFDSVCTLPSFSVIRSVSKGLGQKEIPLPLHYSFRYYRQNVPDQT